MNAPAEDDLVDVAYGIYRERLPLAGIAVGQARRWITPLMHLDRAARSVIDGRLVEDEETTVLAAGQVLMFVKPAGEMG